MVNEIFLARFLKNVRIANLDAAIFCAGQTNTTTAKVDSDGRTGAFSLVVLGHCRDQRGECCRTSGSNTTSDAVKTARCTQSAGCRRCVATAGGATGAAGAAATG